MNGTNPVKLSNDGSKYIISSTNMTIKTLSKKRKFFRKIFIENLMILKGKADIQAKYFCSAPGIESVYYEPLGRNFEI